MNDENNANDVSFLDESYAVTSLTAMDTSPIRRRPPVTKNRAINLFGGELPPRNDRPAPPSRKSQQQDWWTLLGYTDAQRIKPSPQLQLKGM